MTGVNYSTLKNYMANLNKGEKLYFCDDLGRIYVYDANDSCSYNFTIDMISLELKQLDIYLNTEMDNKFWYIFNESEIQQIRDLVVNKNKSNSNELEERDSIFIIKCSQWNFEGQSIDFDMHAAKSYDDAVALLRAIMINQSNSYYSNSSGNVFIIIRNNLIENIAWERYYISKMKLEKAGDL